MVLDFTKLKATKCPVARASYRPLSRPFARSRKEASAIALFLVRTSR
jgi:hypothetical protein